MLENIFYCFRSQKVIECLVLKRPVQWFTLLSPLYRGGSQVFHSDLQEVSLAFCKARNGNQSFFFFFFPSCGRKLYPFRSVHHFWHYLHSCIQIALRWACLWSKIVGLHGGAFFFNPVFFSFLFFNPVFFNEIKFASMKATVFFPASLPFQPQARDDGMWWLTAFWNALVSQEMCAQIGLGDSY